MTDQIKVLAYTAQYISQLAVDDAPQSEIVYALVDDGSPNVQLYAGDAASFDGSKEASAAISWSKYDPQPVNLKNTPGLGLVVSMAYCYGTNAVYIKIFEKNNSRIIILPKGGQQRTIKLGIFVTSEDIDLPVKLRESFHVGSNGDIYCGTFKGVFYYKNDASTFTAQPILVTNKNNYPSIIRGNEAVVAVALQDSNTIRVTRAASPDLQTDSWAKASVAAGVIYDIFFDEYNQFIDVATYKHNDSGLNISTVQYAEYVKHSNANLKDGVRIKLPISAVEFVNENQLSDFIGAYFIDGGVWIGLINPSKKVSVSWFIQGLDYSVIKGHNSFPIDIASTGSEMISRATLIALSYTCATYLHTDGSFYVTSDEGGLGGTFQKIAIPLQN